MFQNNPLLSQLKQQIQKNIPKCQGVVKATDKGYGFLETDKGKSFFIPPNEMTNVLHGDRIDAHIHENGDKSTAEPVNLKQSGTSIFIARLSIKNESDNKTKINLLPTNKLVKGYFRIQGAQKLTEQGYQDGDWVEVELLNHPLESNAVNKGKGFLAQVIKKIAEGNDPFAYRLVSVATYHLPNKAPNLEHSWTVLDPELTRKDLTKVPFFTIDGINTQDMDDAIFIEKNENGWLLTVAISDPAAFIPVDSPIDIEAKKRGFTHYLPNFNVPMLPRDLSDSLCSLKEGEKRATLCCTMHIASDGQLIGEPVMFAAWIKSHFRLNYCDVSNFLENEESSSSWSPSPQLAGLLNLLSEASLKRLNWRTENNLVFKSQPDYTLKLNNKGEVYEILCEPRRTANRLVEESMIAANISVGDFLAKHVNKGVFNTHAGFASDRLKKAVELFSLHGIETDPEKLNTLAGYTTARQKSAEKNNCYLDHRLRKLLTYAETKNEPDAHFTMGVQHYATWTSPIRKYGDLVNHRLIKSILLSKSNNDNEHDINICADLGTHLNNIRRSQRMAERDVNNLLYSQYLQKDIESQWRFKAEIFDIIKAGVRVRIQENGAMFFIPTTLLTKNSQDAKEIECNRELGKVSVANQTELQLGDVIDVLLNNIKAETGQLIGRLADPLIVSE